MIWDDEDAKVLLETLFSQRAVLGRDLTLLCQLDENTAQSGLQFPLHSGAESYYRRNEPGFLAENAESIGLIVTLLLLALSGMHSLHRWYAQRRKNHVDTYYRRIQEILESLDRSASLAQLQGGLEKELRTVEAAACEELIDERLDADHSYVILQNMLQDCDTQIRNCLAHQERQKN